MPHSSMNSITGNFFRRSIIVLLQIILPAVILFVSSAIVFAEDAVPPHVKSISPTEEEDVFELSLDVTGGQSTQLIKPKLDVVFIIDKSRSMEYAISSGAFQTTRLQALKAAATGRGGLTESLLSNSSIDTRLAVVSFYGRNDIGYGAYGALPYDDAHITHTWSSDKASLDSAINSITTSYEYADTNMQAGILLTDELLASARSDAQKIVILLSDGEPTVYYRPDGYTVRNYDAAVGAAYDATRALAPVDGFYAIQYGKDSGFAILNEICNIESQKGTPKVDKFEAETANALSDAFAQITENIIQHGCEDVVIWDKLSAFVELAQSPSDIKMTKTSESGSEVLGSEVVSINYDDSEKTISAVFSDGYTLDLGARYTLSFLIKPTQQAYDAFAEGDGTTEFPSNDDAKLTYRYQPDDSSTTVDYEQSPTFTVDQLDIPVEKRWLKIKPETTLPASVTVDLFQDDGEIPYRTITLNSSDEYRNIFRNVAKGNHTYWVQERDTEGFNCTSVENVGTAAKPSFKVTNTKLPSLTIAKEVGGEYADTQRKFEIEVRLTDENGQPITGSFTTNGADGNGNLSFNSAGMASVQLKHGENIEIQNLPLNAGFRLEEKDLVLSGYEATYYADDHGTLSEDISVRIVNTKKDVVPSGIRSAATVSIGVLAALMMALVLIATSVMKRRR